MRDDIATLAERAVEAEGEEAREAALALADAWLEDGTELEQRLARHVTLTEKFRQAVKPERSDLEMELYHLGEELRVRVPEQLWEGSQYALRPRFDGNGLISGVTTRKGEPWMFDELYLHLDRIAASLGPLFRECLAESHSGKYSRDEVDEDIAASFFASPHLAWVRTLSAWGNNHGAVPMDGFAVSEHLGRLRSLDLCANKLDDDAARGLAGFQFDGVRDLDLHINQIGAEGCAALAGSRLFSGLEELDFRSNPIGNDGARALGAAFPPRLSRLNIGRAKIGATGTRRMLGKARPELTRVSMRDNPIRSGGLRWIAEAGHPKLESLTVGSGKVGADGIEALATTDGLPSLRHLDLHSNELGDRGAKALARWPGLSRLEGLGLASCEIKGPGWKALVDSPHIGGLKSLHANERSANKRDVAFLRKALPDCEIT